MGRVRFTTLLNKYADEIEKVKEIFKPNRIKTL